MSDPELFLTTYPRCASHFLVDYLEQLLDIKFTIRHGGENFNFSVYENQKFLKTHDIDKSKKNQVSIVRDPLSSISSMISMDNNFSNSNLMEIARRNLTRYIEYYAYLLKYVDMIYTYEDVINKTKQVTEDISARISLDIVSYEYKSRLTRDSIENKHVRSSKNLSNYEECKNVVSSFDELLFVANLMYNIVKQKAIIV